MFKRDNKIVASGIKQDNEIYRIFFRVNRAHVGCEVNVSTFSLNVWHERMAHVNTQVLKNMVKEGVVRGVKLSDVNNFFCESWQVTPTSV